MVARKHQYELYEIDLGAAPATAAPQPEERKSPALNKTLRGQCLILVMVLATLAMLVTVRSGQIVGAGYDLVRIKVQTMKLERENELLKLEVARLKSPQRLQAIAAGKLGMAAPKDVYFAVTKDTPPQGAPPVSAKDGMLNALRRAIQ